MNRKWGYLIAAAASGLMTGISTQHAGMWAVVAVLCLITFEILDRIDRSDS